MQNNLTINVKYKNTSIILEGTWGLLFEDEYA